MLLSVTFSFCATTWQRVDGDSEVNAGQIILLYLVTVRARLLTDLANLLFKRQGYAVAERWYRLALRLFPERTSRLVVLVNWGIARLRIGDAQAAIATFEDVLVLSSDKSSLGHKYEAACRCNLSVAYRKVGEDVKALLEFNRVIDLFPASVYSQAAERALKTKREQDSTR